MLPLLVVVPAYNEEAALGTLLDGLKISVPDASVLVVDDGSDDRSAEVARGHGARVVSHPHNLGYGVAVQTGLLYALRRGFGPVVHIDGDGQHDPVDVPRLLEALELGADVAIGSRFLAGAYPSTLLRRLGSRWFAALASLILGQRITDPTSGFRAMQGSVLSLYASEQYPPDYPDADLLILTHRHGFKIKEVAVQMRPRRSGEAKLHRGLRPIYYVIKMMLSILVILLRRAPQTEPIPIGSAPKGRARGPGAA